MDDQHRQAIEDAVIRAMEAGATATDVREEVDYAIETFEAGP